MSVGSPSVLWSFVVTRPTPCVTLPQLRVSSLPLPPSGLFGPRPYKSRRGIVGTMETDLYWKGTGSQVVYFSPADARSKCLVVSVLQDRSRVPGSKIVQGYTDTTVGPSLIGAKRYVHNKTIKPYLSFLGPTRPELSSQGSPGWPESRPRSKSSG